jgi:hypothetical protein
MFKRKEEKIDLTCDIAVYYLLYHIDITSLQHKKIGLTKSFVVLFIDIQRQQTSKDRVLPGRWLHSFRSVNAPSSRESKGGTGSPGSHCELKEITCY